MVYFIDVICSDLMALKITMKSILIRFIWTTFEHLSTKKNPLKEIHDWRINAVTKQQKISFDYILDFSFLKLAKET